jgi:hypothetical protein
LFITNEPEVADAMKGVLKVAETYPRPRQAYLDMMKEKRPLRLDKSVEAARIVCCSSGQTKRFVMRMSFLMDVG